jgi:hypothetical protein
VLTTSIAEQNRIRAICQQVLETSVRSQHLVSGNPVDPSRLSVPQLDEMWREHRDNMFRVIDENLRCGMERAAIVGAGRCDSFRLPDVLKICDERGVRQLDLLDLNVAALNSALTIAHTKMAGTNLENIDGVLTLRTADQSTCRAVGWDATFMLPNLLSELERDLRADLVTRLSNGQDATAAMADITREIITHSIERRSLNNSTQFYDLVISDCLITQINSFFGVTAAAHWLPTLTSTPGATLSAAIEIHEGILTLDHLKMLFRLAGGNGQVVFATDIIRLVAGQPPRPRFMNRGISAAEVLTSLIPNAKITHTYPQWHWSRSAIESEKVSAVSMPSQSLETLQQDT